MNTVLRSWTNPKAHSFTRLLVDAISQNSAGAAGENACIPQGMLFYQVCCAMSPAILGR